MKKAEKKITKRDIVTGVFLALYAAAVLVGGVFLIPKGGLGVLALFGIMILGLILLVTWHSISYSYICRGCRNQFKINFYKDLFSPQTKSTKYLKCPKCGERTWAKEVARN